ncbi:hypothetical protein KY360_03350 [Candidatus Woesearchaeota archaeon]|nr:hypothetical protein [Candidatus Woesearchaeota archaeon]
MIIKKATKKHVKEISRLMLKDLKKPDKRFPKKMIDGLREHAKEENLLKEFNNPKLVSFVAIDKRAVGFVVGYKRRSDIYLDYIAGKNKEKLLIRFIKFCKSKRIIADTFEFMDNYKLYIKNGFKLFKKEEITKDLVISWLKLG